MTDVMTKDFMQKYGRSGSCGDRLADAMRGYLVDDETGRTNYNNFVQLAKDNNVPSGKWDHLNRGQQRMLLGNVLRGKLRRGVDVIVGPLVIPAEPALTT
mgnify:FL=1